MKRTVIPMLLVGLMGIISHAGCSKDRSDVSITGPDSFARLTKTAVLTSKGRAGVMAIVARWQPESDMTGGLGFTFNEVGTPVKGIEVSLSRSVAGQRSNFRWIGTTDSDGIAEIEMVAPPESGQRGISGYFIARATIPETGELLGEWGSIPINGGKEHVVFLPIGSKNAHVESGTGPLSVSLIGSAGSASPDWPLFGSFGWTSTIVFHQNQNGEIWGLSIGYDWARGIGIGGNPPGLVPTEGAEAFHAVETVLTCFDVDLETNTVWFKVKNKRDNPVGGAQNHPVEAKGYFQQLGGPGQDIYSQALFIESAIPGFPSVTDFDPPCGSRWEHPVQPVTETSTLRIVRH